MAYKVTNVWVRPNTGVAWFKANTTQKNYFTGTFDNTGKRNIATSESGDSLTLTNVSTFTNNATKIEWDNDSTVQSYKTARRQYNRNNSITLTQTIEE